MRLFLDDLLTCHLVKRYMLERERGGVNTGLLRVTDASRGGYA